MHRGLLLVFSVMICANIFAQTDTAYARQCSALREIVYQSSQDAFKNILDTRLRGSSGYQVNGAWTFSNEHYSTTLPWEGAASTLIEHSTDSRDSTETESWQYLATFASTPYRTVATKLYEQVVSQINDCVLPLTDSISVNLQPIDPIDLPANKPDNLTDAYLFVFPKEAAATKETSIMVGLERVRNGYKVMLMVELLEEKRKQ